MKVFFKQFVNPYEDNSERSLLILGLSFFVIGSILSYYRTILFDGIINVHSVGDLSLTAAFYNNFANVILLSVILFYYGVLIYEKTRLIDVVNVVLISRIVIYLISPVVSIPFIKNSTHKLVEELQEGKFEPLNTPFADMLSMVTMGFVSIALLVYFFYLMIVGMQITMNSKKIGHSIFTVIIIFFVDTICHLYFPYLTN